MGATSAVGKPGRLPSLDGLRGAAALIVVFHHLSLLFSPIYATYFAPRSPEAHSEVWSLAWWVTSTPAQFLLAGPEAVLVFFVLSGLVVALPVLNRPNFNWVSYYPQRLARLYVPAAASVILALLVRAAADVFAADGLPSAIGDGTSWQSVLGALDLVSGNLSINVPLWTLRWEVVFSVMLPLFVTAAVAGRKIWPILALAAGGAAVVGSFNQELTSFTYLPIFLLGSIIAVKFNDISGWVDTSTRTRLVQWSGLAILVASVLLTTLHATIVGVFPAKFRLQETSLSLEFIGCIGLVLVAAFWKPAVRGLSSALFQWLGRVSFSLYLVHAPVIVAAYTIIGPGQEVATACVALAASLILAEVFTRLVERPSHKLAKRVGAASAAAMAGWSARSEQRTSATPRATPRISADVTPQILP